MYKTSPTLLHPLSKKHFDAYNVHTFSQKNTVVNPSKSIFFFFHFTLHTFIMTFLSIYCLLVGPSYNDAVNNKQYNFFSHFFVFLLNISCILCSQRAKSAKTFNMFVNNNRCVPSVQYSDFGFGQVPYLIIQWFKLAEQVHHLIPDIKKIGSFLFFNVLWNSNEIKRYK